MMEHKAEWLSAKQGESMSILTRAIPAAVTLAVVSVITAILWYLKVATASPHDPVFFYLLPLMLVAILYGSRPALLGAVTAFACADFFLYDPLYSFDICSRAELGDLSCFALLALIGVKCTSELFRPVAKVPAAKSFYARR
jgi:K+-sensing histidine kinase KdpD